ARDDVFAAGAVARILQLLVCVTCEGECIDDAVTEQQRLTVLIRSERLAAKQNAGAQGAVEIQREDAVGRRPVARGASRSGLRPRKRSQSETSGKQLEHVSTTDWIHGGGVR